MVETVGREGRYLPGDNIALRFHEAAVVVEKSRRHIHNHWRISLLGDASFIGEKAGCRPSA